MTSTSATEGSSSPSIQNSSMALEKPSPKLPPTKITVDTPPSIPALELSSRISSEGLGTVEITSAAIIAQPTRPVVSVFESLSDLEDGEIVEQDQLTASDTDTSGAEANATEGSSDHIDMEQSIFDTVIKDLPIVVAEGKKTVKPDTYAIKETYGPETERSPSLDPKNLPVAIQSSIIAPGFGSHDQAERQRKAADEAQSSSVEEKEVTSKEREDDSVGDDEDTAGDSQRHGSTVAAPSQSIPPHVRPVFKAPNSHYVSVSGGRPYLPLPSPRGSRGYYPSNVHQLPRPPVDLDEVQRTKAQLMKARSDLEVERKVNAEMRAKIGAEKQASIGAAFTNMLNELLQKQADALAVKARTLDKERDLQYREQKITQIETYLAVGQQQLSWNRQQQGIGTMSSTDEANLRREVELKMKHQFSDIEGKISFQVERLRHQEAAQKLREQQYKILTRDAIENEIREQISMDMQAKNPDIQITQAAYERGPANTKDSGGVKSSENELKQEFLKGYAACYRNLTVLHNVRTGKIAVESPEIAFLFDPTHVQNPHNVGLSIGRLEASLGKVETAARVVISQRSMANGTIKAAAIQNQFGRPADAVAHHGCDQSLFDNDKGPSDSSQLIANLEPLQRDQSVCATRSCVPSRSTFAGELRGSRSAPAVPIDLSASRSDARSTTSEMTTVPTASGAAKVVTVGHVGEGVYAGRRIVRYEEEDDDAKPASTNLIDLY